MDEKRLLAEFYTKGGKEVLKCIQCGTCSGSCPLAGQMDHAPRELFALIRDGGMREAIRSDTPWFCVSCYQCMVRCPREIPVTDLMYTLKQMATEHGTAPALNKLPDLYAAFERVVEQTGRVTESVLMGLYGVRHPKDAATNIPLALEMLKRRRLEFVPQTVRDRKRMAKLLSRGKKEGGES